MIFLDTNILLYAVSTDPTERDKAAVARALLDRSDLSLSVQVLQEFYVQATRPSRDGALTHDQATALVESFRRFPIEPLTADLVTQAMTTRARYQISYWDAAIIEAARAAGCRAVLSEDLNDGQVYGSVRVENPFRPG
ncbi:MAG: PIN domain-containing protein [Acidobacteriota bacterium]